MTINEKIYVMVVVLLTFSKSAYNQKFQNTNYIISSDMDNLSHTNITNVCNKNDTYCVMNLDVNEMKSFYLKLDNNVFKNICDNNEICLFIFNINTKYNKILTITNNNFELQCNNSTFCRIKFIFKNHNKVDFRKNSVVIKK